MTAKAKISEPYHQTALMLLCFLKKHHSLSYYCDDQRNATELPSSSLYTRGRGNHPISATPCDTQAQQCQPWHGSLKSRAKKDYHPILTPDCNPAFTQSLLSPR